MVLGASFTIVGFVYLAAFAGVQDDVLPYAIGSSVAVILMGLFGWRAPAND